MNLRNTTLDDLASVVGFTATVELSAWFGDSDHNLWVPTTLDEGMLLPKLIGMPAARRMVEAWPGEHLAVPRMQGFEEAARRRFIGRLLERGFSTKETASRLRISERRVQQICRELEQLGLIEIVLPKTGSRKGPREMAPKNATGKSPPKTVGKSTPRIKGGQAWKK